MKIIELNHGKFAMVDDEDFEAVNQFKWHLCIGRGNYYALRNYVKNNGKRSTQSMHVFLMGKAGSGNVIDHRDGNGLNNQRSNLRSATYSGNGANRTVRKILTSKYLGVCWYPKYGKWRASMTFNKKSKSLGYFNKEEEAALRYNEMAKQLHGEFAHLNIIQ